MFIKRGHFEGSMLIWGLCIEGPAKNQTEAPMVELTMVSCTTFVLAARPKRVVRPSAQPRLQAKAECYAHRGPTKLGFGTPKKAN